MYLSQEKEREREIINSANKSVKYPLGRKKKKAKEERGRIILTWPATRMLLLE